MFVLPTNFTKKLKYYAAIFWSAGLAFAIFDYKFGYPMFFLAATFCYWAEKREFSTRGALYRIHDVAIYSSWKYLLLYFLWASIFAPFTRAPLESIKYGLLGWFCLLAVGISAQFIFCERNSRGISLLPDRLRLVFIAYAVAMICLFSCFLLHIYEPNEANLFLYFSIGLPFLIWDLAYHRRYLVPKYLNAICIALGVTILFFSSKFVFVLSIVAACGGMFALSIYKKLRLKKFLIACLALAFLSAPLILVLAHDPFVESVKVKILNDLEKRKNLLSETLQVTERTAVLGLGLGITKVKEGISVRILSEAGVVGLLLYMAYFISLLKNLYFIRHANRIVVSNVAFISVLIFLLVSNRFLTNPYSAIIWVWYSIWSLFAATTKRKELSL